VPNGESTLQLWSTNTQSVTGKDCVITHLNAVEVEWKQEGGHWQMREKPDSAFTRKADRVLLAMDFFHAVHEGLLQQLGVELDGRGQIKANEKQYSTSVDKVFAAGDGRRGQSLMVWAIHEGRQAARAVDEYLMGGFGTASVAMSGLLFVPDVPTLQNVGQR
jgi:glutamate synthase (NADPH/NADH) small chain